MPDIVVSGIKSLQRTSGRDRAKEEQLDGAGRVDADSRSGKIEFSAGDQKGQLDVLIPGFLCGFFTDAKELARSLGRCSIRGVRLVWDEIRDERKTEDLYQNFLDFMRRNLLLIE
jgi:hypothetical protein